MKKPIFTPSAIADWDSCLLKYHLRWERALAFPSGVAVQPQLGTFGHELHAAHERSDSVTGALTSAVKKVRLSTAYTAVDFPVIQQLHKDALMIFKGGSVKNSQGKVCRFPGYKQYRDSLRIRGQKLITIACEEALVVDLGPIIIAPTLDLVLITEDEQEMWVAEHKFTERDDTDWELRWGMDGQTTLQVMAAEEFYNREVKGLLLLTVSYGRKRTKDGEKSILNRPIGRVERREPRWIVKNSEALRIGMMDRLEDLSIEYEMRLDDGRWPPTGMFTRACDRCSYRGICSGKDSAKRLQPMLKDAHEQKLVKLRKQKR